MKHSRLVTFLRRAAVLLALGAFVLLVLPREARPVTGQWLARAHLQPHTMRIGNFDVRYARVGHGAPVILIHGLASNIYSWADVIGPLCEQFDVIALDLPGFGESTQPSDLTFADHPKAVLGLMDGLGIAKASLVGNSLGGAIALLLAERNPDRVDHVVVLDSAGFGMRTTERPFMIRVIGSRLAGEIADRAPVKRLLTSFTIRHLMRDDTRVTEERINEYLAPLLRPGALASTQSLLASPVDERFASDLPSITAPTLIIWGRYDPWLPESHADRFVAAIKGARKVVLETGHMPQEEAPAEVVRLIRGHLIS